MRGGDVHAGLPSWMRPTSRMLGRHYRRLQHRVRSELSQVHPDPVFVLGNQKSGTSAVAGLLARTCGLTASLDMLQETTRPIFQRVVRGEMPFDDYVRANRFEFSHGVVKEPNLTLLQPQIAARFPDAPTVFVLRDPRDNLRSLLNALRIPGDLDALGSEHRGLVNAGWDLVLDGRWLGIEGDHYIEQLAGRWVYCANVYRENAASMQLCRYEDFVADKLAELSRLAAAVGRNVTTDVSDSLDLVFQPAGDRGVGWQTFFGTENLARIERICGEAMEPLGYSPDA